MNALDSTTCPTYNTPARWAVYEIVCLPTGKRYIGYTKKTERRISLHISALKRGRHPNKALLADFQIHSQDAFKWKVLVLCDSQDQARDAERSLLLSDQATGKLYNERFEVTRRAKTPPSDTQAASVTYASLINFKQAAALCGITRQSLYYHTSTGTGPATIKISGKPYFNPATLLTWNEARKKRRKRRGMKA